MKRLCLLLLAWTSLGCGGRDALMPAPQALTGPSRLVVDNEDEGFQLLMPEGGYHNLHRSTEQWSVVQTPGGGANLGRDYLEVEPRQVEMPLPDGGSVTSLPALAAWRAVLAPGRYRVLVRVVPDPRYVKWAFLCVSSAEGEREACGEVHQAQGEPRWEELGTYALAGEARVVLDPGAMLSVRRIFADAVVFELVGRAE